MVTIDLFGPGWSGFPCVCLCVGAGLRSILLLDRVVHRGGEEEAEEAEEADVGRRLSTFELGGHVSNSWCVHEMGDHGVGYGLGITVTALLLHTGRDGTGRGQQGRVWPGEGKEGVFTGALGGGWGGISFGASSVGCRYVFSVRIFFCLFFSLCFGRMRV